MNEPELSRKMPPTSSGKAISRGRMPRTADPQLGLRLAYYRGRPLFRSSLFNLWAPGVLGVLAPLAFGLFQANCAYTHYGPAAVPRWSQPWYGLAAVALVIFLLLFVMRLIQSRHYIAVHRSGLRLRTGILTSLRLPWSELSGIATSTTRDHFLGLTLRTRQRARLFPNVGAPIHLPAGIEDLSELISRLKASLYPRLMPGLKAAFEAGKWIYFGPVAVSKPGLSLDRSASRKAAENGTPWSQIRQVDICGGFLIIAWNDRRPSKLPVGQIPNIELLLQIIQQGVHV